MKALQLLDKLRQHFSDPQTWVHPSFFTLTVKIEEISGQLYYRNSAYNYLDEACQIKGSKPGSVSTFALRGENAHNDLMDMLSEATVLALNAGEQ
jgi:hypothetical protein